jgi:CHAT domain-containing protein
VASSYTPTLSALLNAQKKAPQTAPHRLSVLTIAEDCVATGSALQPLWFVEREVTTVAETAKASKHKCSVDAIASHATVERVTDRVQAAHFVHLACHGTQDQTNALNSGFHLSNGKLSDGVQVDEAEPRQGVVRVSFGVRDSQGRQRAAGPGRPPCCGDAARGLQECSGNNVVSGHSAD